MSKFKTYRISHNENRFIIDLTIDNFKLNKDSPPGDTVIKAGSMNEAIIYYCDNNILF